MNEPYMNTQGYQLIEQYYSDGYRITEFLLDGTLNVTMIPWVSRETLIGKQMTINPKVKVLIEPLKDLKYSL